MAFCYNCGKQLNDGSKFCSECGVKQEVNDNTSVRKQEFIGILKKCPSCGEELKSLTGICPSCGHEINNKIVNKSLKEFIDKVSELENNIDGYSAIEKKGWSTWNGGIKLGWILLNMALILTPLIFYYIWKLISLVNVPKLEKEEKDLSYFIQNYQFPNDRESILEALIYVRDKIDFIANYSINKKTYYWTKIWVNKARELKSKADILFTNDKIVNNCYDDIIEKSREAKKKLIIKTILIIVGVTLFFVIIFLLPSSEEEYNKTLKLPNTGIVERLPKVDYKYGNVITDSSNDINFEIYKVSQNDYDEYVRKCKDDGFDIEYKKDNKVFKAKDKANYVLKISYDKSKEKMKVHLNSYNVKK